MDILEFKEKVEIFEVEIAKVTAECNSIKDSIYALSNSDTSAFTEAYRNTHELFYKSEQEAFVSATRRCETLKELKLTLFDSLISETFDPDMLSDILKTRLDSICEDGLCNENKEG